ncbi:MAG: hypothetical protein J7L94_14975 [Caldisericaceae bacterium]|nr:hypothetical protein [Caldisericaceae bacterium]
MKQKEAKANVEIDLQIKRCRSQMALSGKSVENKKFTHVFKAARWSASGFNEHPWPFSAGSKGKGQAATDILPDKLKKK